MRDNNFAELSAVIGFLVGVVGGYSFFQAYPTVWITVAIYKIAIWILSFTSLKITTFTATLTACALMGLLAMLAAFFAFLRLEIWSMKIKSERAKQALETGGKAMSVKQERDLLIKRFGED